MDNRATSSKRLPRGTNSADGRRWSRRRFVATAGGFATAGFAGCLGGASDEDGADVVASFFTFYDFARQVVDGTPVTIDNLVPTGLHGHGWEPDFSITEKIVTADAFVYVGPEFQPWADRAIETVRDDDADTHLIDARKGIELMDLPDTVDEDEQVGEGKDPHFWLDPDLAKASVDNVVDGLVEIAPDHEDAFVANAADVKAELDEIDAEWEAIFDAAERETVFLAAHNAFGYVGERYGATIQPLVTNLAATDDVRPADMRRARETIDDNDIQYIGAAIFEPRRPAQQLRESTDVEAYYPVTPYAGTKEEWVDRGWGYFEIARNINMPTFRVVLGAMDPDGTEFDDEWRNFE